MGKKNLDKLFQEKFTGFSEVPDKKVWEQIEASLDKKKKTRMFIPIWWKLGGVAAVLAILIYAINPFGSTPDVDQKVADVEKIDKNNLEKITEKEDITEIPRDNDAKVVNAGKVDKKNDFDNAQDVKENMPSYANIEKSVKSRIKQSEKDKGDILTKNRFIVKELQITDTDVKKTSKTEVENPISTQKDIPVIPKDANETLVASENKKSNITSTGLDRNKARIEKSVQGDITKSKKESIANIEEKNKNVTEALKKKSIFDEIQEQDENDLKVAEGTNGKWSIGANIAPVYFDAFGEGSPVHSIFVSNSKSGAINLSYGLSVSYTISKKLSLRTGLNKVDYGYDTNEVEFTSSFGVSGDGQIANIDYTIPSMNLVLDSKLNTGPSKNSFIESQNQNIGRDGVMTQQFGYLEVPVELSYALMNKKFGLSLVGGVSSLFLVANSVAVTSSELTTEIGEANNLNAVNFSTNIGFGINYNFSPKVELNVEPVFKYQLNTFSNTAGDFQPFSAGVYSGLRFKF